jgi:hypothetical protein
MYSAKHDTQKLPELASVCEWPHVECRCQKEWIQHREPHLVQEGQGGPGRHSRAESGERLGKIRGSMVLEEETAGSKAQGRDGGGEWGRTRAVCAGVGHREGLSSPES